MKAMILAAGRGERMRPLTDRLPKPLVPVAGRPLVEWTIARLAAAGIHDIVINHAHLGTRLEEALGDGSRLGVAITYSREAAALETAGGIAYALPLLGPGPFVVVNGDVFCDYPFESLVHRARGQDWTTARATLAHLVLVDNPPHHALGDFAWTDGGVRCSGAPMLTFSGIGLYARQLFADIAPGSRAPLGPLLRRAIDAGRATAEHFGGCWHDVGTLERLDALERALARAT